jgi:O-antigen ligase
LPVLFVVFYGSDPMTKPWVFKDHISAGLMMAFLGYLAMALATAVRKGTGGGCCIWSLCSRW